MSTVQKRQLKSAKEAIQAENYEYAQQLCKDILEEDPCNYTAMVFLGLSNSKMKLLNEAVYAYENAIKAYPNQPLAYQGLKKLYEDENNDAGILKVLEMQSNLIVDDPVKSLEYLEKRTEITRKIENPSKLVKILSSYLNNVSIAKLTPKLKLQSILKEIIDIKSAILESEITTSIGERRMRLDAESLPILTRKVEKEFYLQSDLHLTFEEFLASMDEYDAVLAEKYIQFLSKKLIYCKDDERTSIRNKFEAMARIHLENHFSLLAITMLVESCDQKLENRDLTILRQYETKIKRLDDPMAKILTALILYRSESSQNLDALSLLLEGLEYFPNSVVGNVLHVVLLYETREWMESQVQAEKTLMIIQEFTNLYQIPLAHVAVEIQTIIGNACLNLGSSHITQSLVVFKTILIVCPKDTEALLGLGRCFSTISSLDEAKNCFVQILDDNDNSEAKSELGWVYFLQGHYEESLSIIRSSLIADPSGKNYFRIARVYYAMGKEYVSNKEFAHAHLIKAIKLDPQFSPSFTLLGKYYRDYEKDIVRSIKCYSKAISINPVEADAVSSLSEIWILQGKVADASELLQQYVLLNTRASWAWKQLGILMLDITPAESILCFQACLRLEPNNAKCWTCLGEAYYNEGKYVASIRALDRALVLDNSLIIAMYFRAIVNRRIGNYIDSISDFSKILNDPNQKIAPAFCYGMAETCISYAVELFADGYFGSCLSHLLLAIENCSKVYNLHLLELAGLACLHLLELVPALIDFSCINPALQLFNLLREKKPSDTNASQIFVDCGIFCFQFFLKNVAVISPISASAIYSSMANLHLHSYKLDQNESRMEYAVSSIKSAIKLGSQRWEYWSNYGLLLHRCDKRLSQELFTKAIEFGALQPQPWSNLGFFYLLEGAYELAMQCFEKAQFAVLDYPNSWLGQAILAGLLGNEQSFKFFEHAYDIAKVSNTEILFQYARQCYLFPNHHSSSEVDASFALRKCVELKLADCNMYNLYGLFLERQKKYCAAIDIYYTALSLIHDINQEKAISENLARCLCAKGQFKESVRFFEKALEIGGDAFTLAGCGLSLYFLGHYKDSLFKFQEAINGLPEGNQDMNHFVSLLLSKVLFAFGTSAHIELSKQELFKCFATDPNFIPAVICLCAMGIALDDFVLAQTAAAELIKLDPISMRGNEFDVDLVLSLLFSATSDPKTATRFLVKTVHRQPWLAGGWYRISLHLYCNSPRELNMSNNLTTSALRVNIQAASHIKTNSAGERSSLFLQYGLSKFEISGVDRKVKSSISKALFLSPSSAKNWTALSMALLEGQESLTVAKKLAVSAEKLEPSQFNQLIVLASELRYESIKNSVSKIEEISDTSSGHLKQVASAVLAHSMVTLGKHDQAIQLFEEAISLKGITYVWLNPSIRLSQILVERGLFDDALKCIARCKADFLPASHLFQAAILIWQGKFSEALASVGNVLKLDGENVLGKFQQTLLFRKLDAKKNHSRIERNFEYLEGKIDSIEMQWLKKC